MQGDITISAKLKNSFDLALELSKSGIVLLVLMTAAFGYLVGHPLESRWSWLNFAEVLAGIAFLAGGSAALNQVQEHEIDQRMERTRLRPIPSGKVTLIQALIFSLLSMVLGLIFLSLTNRNVVILGALSVLSYNGMYTMWWKKKMAFGAVPGAIPGALPILMGYQAAHPSWSDPRGYFLFAILFFWQMPHFWVLAIKYSDDYGKGGFPTLPVAHGVEVTRNQIVLWCLAYVGLGLLCPLFFPVGILGIVGCVLVGAWVLKELVGYIRVNDPKKWLRFFLAVNFSLIFYLAVITIDLWSVLVYRRA